MRLVSVFLFAALVALAVVIYQVKYQTRALEARAAEIRLSVGKERDAIAVLRAEWSHLNRPERVERLARKHLGLKPLSARQMITLDRVPTRWSSPTSDPNARPEGGAVADARRRSASAMP